MIFMPRSCSHFHELENVANKTTDRSSSALLTHSVHIANSANFDPISTNIRTSMGDPSVP